MKKEGLFKFLFAAAALFSVLAVVVISLFLFASAFPTIKEIGPINFLFGKIWKPSNDIYGIFPMNHIRFLCCLEIISEYSYAQTTGS